MNDPKPWLVKAGVCAAAALAFYSVIDFVQWEDAFRRNNIDPYSIFTQEARFGSIRSRLPEGTAAGYVTDLPPGSVQAQAAFASARYALAPRMLVELSDGAEWVIGNFSRPPDVAAIAKQNGLTPVDDFGNGVVLFRRKPR